MEGVHKRAVKIILGEKFVDYKSALESLKIETLRDRGFQQIMCYGQCLLASPLHQHYLTPTAECLVNARKKTKLVPVFCRTNRFNNSFGLIFTNAYNNKKIS